MLYSGKKLIVESIKKDAQFKALKESFINKVKNSPSLTLEYMLNEYVAKYSNKLSLQEANVFARFLKRKYENHIKNTNYDLKAKNDLFEAFDVKDKVTKTEYDYIIDFAKGTINESVVVSLVHCRDSKEKERDEVKKIRESLEKVYENLLHEKNNSLLLNRLPLIEGLARTLSDSDRKMVVESIKFIKNSSQTEYKQSVNKAYKLNTLVESLNFASRKRFLSEDDFDKQELALEKEYAGKVQKIGNVGMFNGVKVENTGKIDGAFIVDFSFDFYPYEPFYTERFNEIGVFGDSVEKLRLQIANIFRTEAPGHFSSSESRIFTSARKQVTNTDLDKMGGKVAMSVELQLFINDPLIDNEPVEVVTEALKKVEKLFQEKFAVYLTADEQEKQKIDAKSTTRISDPTKLKYKDVTLSKWNKYTDDEWMDNGMSPVGMGTDE